MPDDKKIINGEVYTVKKISDIKSEIDDLFDPPIEEYEYSNFKPHENGKTIKFYKSKRVNLISLLLISLVLLSSCYPAFSVLNPTVTLFARSGNTAGEFYTLFSDGLEKEKANIGGFNSAKLDPLEQNIYFYDPILKVISRINLDSGKVYKEIGNPKSTAVLDYSKPVLFNEANLNMLVDFSFDKYGNIYYLQNQIAEDTVNKIPESGPVLFKASIKDKTISRILNLESEFRVYGIDGSIQTKYYLTGLSYDGDKYIYLYGSAKYPYLLATSPAQISGNVIFRLDTSNNEIETIAASYELAYNERGYKFGITNAQLKGLIPDGDNLYISYIEKNLPYTVAIKLSDTASGVKRFIGNGTGSLTDIGDGGSSLEAFATVLGAKPFCTDKSGDLLIADSSSNRIRRIYKQTGLINTIVGSGTDTIAFGQSKLPKSISLTAPNSIFADKKNNLYIVEPNRILLATDTVTYYDKPLENVKIASLIISKIAGQNVIDPKGDVSIPDVLLNYSSVGDQPVEITGKNIPDGTNIKIISTDKNGYVSPDTPQAKLSGGIASIPIKIEAGVPKVIKAESDPFVPAQGVYLEGTEPKTIPGVLPSEPTFSTPKRDDVNKAGNLLSYNSRFNLSKGWRQYSVYDYIVNPFSAIDPDSFSNDANLLSFNNYNNTIYYSTAAPGKVTFSLWMRTDSGNIPVLLGIGDANCPDIRKPESFNYSGWEACRYPYNFAYWNYGNMPKLTYQNATATPTWQKFTITTDANTEGLYYKSLFIGGGETIKNKKIYLWGLRLEQVQ